MRRLHFTQKGDNHIEYNEYGIRQIGEMIHLANTLVSISEKKKNLDFSKPSFNIEIQDSEENRQKILSISYSEWKKMEFSK